MVRAGDAVENPILFSSRRLISRLFVFIARSRLAPGGGCASSERVNGLVRTDFDSNFLAPGHHAKMTDVRPNLLSPRLHEALQHHLSTRLVEIDGQLIAVHRRDSAGAELQVQHPRAGCVTPRR